VPSSGLRHGAGYAIFNPAQYPTWWTPSVYYEQTGAWFMLMAPTSLFSKVYGLGDYPQSLFGDGFAVATPAEAKAIDKKMDDGLPTMGQVIATKYWDAGSTGNCASTRLNPYNMRSTSPSTSITYLVTNTNTVCNVLFYLGGN
jgi:hypothetical protein